MLQRRKKNVFVILCIGSIGSKQSFRLPVYCVLHADAISQHVKEVSLHSGVGWSSYFLPIEVPQQQAARLV